MYSKQQTSFNVETFYCQQSFYDMTVSRFNMSTTWISFSFQISVFSKQQQAFLNLAEISIYNLKLGIELKKTVKEEIRINFGQK